MSKKDKPARLEVMVAKMIENWAPVTQDFLEITKKVLCCPPSKRREYLRKLREIEP